MPPVAQTSGQPSARETVFTALAGVWLALALLKFGNPVILQHRITTPSTREELLIGPWPILWGILLFGTVLLSSFAIWRRRTLVPKWLLALPLAWLVWQALSATQTVDPTLTAATLKHFSVCTAACYVGLFAFSHVSRPGIFWMALLGGFAVVMLSGWRQHFGGLEEARRYLYSLPDWQELPPEFLKKASSDRIYGTLFYPNALAGVILLFLPISLSQLWIMPVPPLAKSVSCIAAVVLGFGCLYWSGSKAGWLIVVVQGLVVLIRSRASRPMKIAAAVLIISAGLAGFWVKYHGYFDRGATSVSARFDYWHSAWQTFKDKPLLGTGPGTFMVTYRALKRPDAEMARLAHNDFLQQGSDSGWPGFLFFAGFMLGSLIIIYRGISRVDWPAFGVWLGLFGVTLQSLVEFGLYIPALAWPTFFLLGFLLGRVYLPNEARLKGK